VGLNVADLFEAVADTVPERLALVGGQVRRTFAELDERSNRLAHHLVANGVMPGSFVGMLARNRVEWIEVMLGCFKARTVPVNLNYRYVAPELRYVIDNADLAALVHERSFDDLVAESCSGLPCADHRLVLADESPGSAQSYEEALGVSNGRREGLPRRSGDDLYVLYTGGTTGMPKGVLWRQEDLYLGPLGGAARRGGPVTSADDLIRRLPDESVRQIALVVPPMMHGTGQWASFSALLSGGSVVLYTEVQFDPEMVWELVAREEITMLVMVGDVMGRPLADSLGSSTVLYDTSSIALLISSGAPLTDGVRNDLLAKLGEVRISNRLGSSESGTVGIADGNVSGASNPGVGQFMVSNDTTVLDGDLRPVKPGSGVIGKLARRGHIPIGYHKDPEGTSATFVVDQDGTRWVLPGDFAGVLNGGLIALFGRGSTTINSGGEKIFPHEVEAALKHYPRVYSAIVVGVPDERFGEVVGAVVQARPGETPTAEELRIHCRAHVAGYKVPKLIAMVDSLPLTAVGKPDHLAAREIVIALSTPNEGSPEVDEVDG
jgi:acyl-CoA synthetase (AMP-forming)/AMP-acid ligase II